MFFPAALSPLEGMLEAEKKSKADAMAAKNSVEKKARDFVNEQNNTIEQITKAKVSNTWCFNVYLSVELNTKTPGI